MELTTKGISSLVTVLIVVSAGMVGMAWLQTTTQVDQSQSSDIQREIIDLQQYLDTFKGTIRSTLVTESQEETDRIGRLGGNQYTGSNYERTYWVCANHEQIPTTATVKDALRDRIEKEVRRKEATFATGTQFVDTDGRYIDVGTGSTEDFSTSANIQPDPENDQFTVNVSYDNVTALSVPENVDGIAAQQQESNVNLNTTVKENRFWYMYHTMRDWASNTTGLGDEVRNAVRLIAADHRRVKPCLPQTSTPAFEAVQNILNILQTFNVLSWFGVDLSGPISQVQAILDALSNACGYGAGFAYSPTGQATPLEKAQILGMCIKQRGDPEIDKQALKKNLDTAVRVGMQEEMHQLENEIGFEGNDVNCRYQFNNHPDGSSFPNYKVEVYKTPIPPNQVEYSDPACIGPSNVPYLPIGVCASVCQSWGYSLGFEVNIDTNIVCQDTRYNNSVPTEGSKTAEKINLWTREDTSYPVQANPTSHMWNINLSFQVNEKGLTPSPNGSVEPGSYDDFPAEIGPQTYRNCYVGSDGSGAPPPPPPSGGSTFCEVGETVMFSGNDRVVEVENKGIYTWPDGTEYCFARNKTNLGSQSNGEDWRINLNYTEGQQEYVRAIYNATTGYKDHWLKSRENQPQKRAKYFKTGQLKRCTEGSKFKQWERKVIDVGPPQQKQVLKTSCLDSSSSETPEREEYVYPNAPDPIYYVATPSIKGTDFCQADYSCWNEGEVNQ